MQGPVSAPLADPLRPTVFHEAWWLNAATGGQYDEAVVVQSGRTVGCMAYAVERLGGGQTLCRMPGPTPLLGPAIDEGKGTAANRLLRRAQITRELLAQLPRCSGCRHRLHRGIGDTLVYQELGYQASVQFTFAFAAAPQEALWGSMHEPTRALIGRCESRYRVRFLDDGGPFTPAAGAAVASGGEAAGRVCRAAIARGQGRVIAAETLTGIMRAAVLMVWDARTAYCVLTARAGDCEEDAMAFLLWQAMQASAGRGLTLDLGGSAFASAERLAGFGGQIGPRYVVSRFSPAYKLAGRLRSMFGGRPQLRAAIDAQRKSVVT